MLDTPVRPRPDAAFAASGQRAEEGPHRILIGGGGAGGLSLAINLCRRLGAERPPRAEVVLVDNTLTHVWKPRLHELAAGTALPAHTSHDYLDLARRHGFRFHPGQLESVDRSTRDVWLEPMIDGEGRFLASRRSLAYDTLVLATGSTSDPFGTPGVKHHACTVDTPQDARRLHQRLLAECTRSELSDTGPVRVVIVGGGPTGVELAIELSEAVATVAEYGARLRTLSRPAQITVIEAAGQLLSTLPRKVIARVEADFARRGITVQVGQRTVEVSERSVVLENGSRLAADVTVWTAGTRGGPELEHLGGLATNRQGQLLVNDHLQTTRDPHIFALGDCCQLDPELGGTPFVPNAQCAHQQADFLGKGLVDHRLAGQPLPPFLSEDKGTLVALGQHDAIAQAPVIPAHRRLLLEGLAVRWAYDALEYRHASLLVGPVRAALAALARWLARRGRPRIHLH